MYRLYKKNELNFSLVGLFPMLFCLVLLTAFLLRLALKK